MVIKRKHEKETMKLTPSSAARQRGPNRQTPEPDK